MQYFLLVIVTQDGKYWCSADIGETENQNYHRVKFSKANAQGEMFFTRRETSPEVLRHKPFVLNFYFIFFKYCIT